MDKILFIDDAQIASSCDVVRCIHPARKYENPVLTSDRAWEGQETILGTVLKEGDQYRMWYQTFATAVDPDGVDSYHRSFHLYAESDDGLAWSKPELGLAEDLMGSRANNITLVRPAFRRDLNPSVLHTPDAPDGHAYRMFSYGAGYIPTALTTRSRASPWPSTTRMDECASSNRLAPARACSPGRPRRSRRRGSCCPMSIPPQGNSWTCTVWLPRLSLPLSSTRSRIKQETCRPGQRPEIRLAAPLRETVPLPDSATAR